MQGCIREIRTKRQKPGCPDLGVGTGRWRAQPPLARSLFSTFDETLLKTETVIVIAARPGHRARTRRPVLPGHDLPGTRSTSCRRIAAHLVTSCPARSAAGYLVPGSDRVE